MLISTLLQSGCNVNFHFPSARMSASVTAASLNQLRGRVAAGGRGVIVGSTRSLIPASIVPEELVNQAQVKGELGRGLGKKAKENKSI